MANAAWNNQRFDKRLNYLKAALGFSESSVRAALLSDIAGTLVILNRKDEAETYYRKAIAENPAAEYHYQYFAQMLQQQKRWKEAEDVLSDFARQHPESPMIKRIRGDYYKSRGNWNRARQLYQDALAQEKNIDVYLTLYNMSSEYERQAIVQAFRQAFPKSKFRYILSAYLQANNRKQQALSKIKA
jgi:tetratricopeptide (TPR) repeat protein